MRVAAIVVGLVLTDAARADGISADIELVHPTFAADSVAGIDEVRPPARRDVRVGFVAQYERNPLILRTPASRYASVVGNRIGFELGASLDLSRRFTLRAILPFAGQWGSTAESLAVDRFGARDLGLGGTFRITGDEAPVSLGLRADLAFPVGAKAAWLGEETTRFSGGIVASGAVGPVAWSGDVGVTGRSAVDAGNDFTLGSEAWVGVNGRLPVSRNVAVLAAGVARFGFLETFGGGETGLEALVGARWTADRSPRIDLLLGKGVGNGYGTTDFRITVACTWSAALYKEDLRPRLVEAEEPEEDDRVVDLPTPIVERSFEIEAPAPERPLVTLVGSRIEVRDPIKFEFNTHRVLPESLPTLAAIAALVRPGDLLVIEGHASEEGPYRYNYDLSVGRAQSIYEELLRSGISANNLAWRALGEVAPAALGSDEKQLAENRRVSFYVVHLSDMPAPAPTITLPWDGTAVPAHVPPGPRTPPPERSP